MFGRFLRAFCDLLRQIVALASFKPGLTGLVMLVLDNARDQRCVRVTSLAATLPIAPQFLPSYSPNPNLNLIERLWKFVKRDVLYDAGLDNLPTTHRPQLATLMTHYFQHFNSASFLIA